VVRCVLIHLTQDNDQWRVLLNTAMKIRIPQKLLKKDSAP
jgi:hypothetical protein